MYFFIASSEAPRYLRTLSAVSISCIGRFSKESLIFSAMLAEISKASKRAPDYRACGSKFKSEKQSRRRFLSAQYKQTFIKKANIFRLLSVDRLDRALVVEQEPLDVCECSWLLEPSLAPTWSKFRSLGFSF